MTADSEYLIQQYKILKRKVREQAKDCGIEMQTIEFSFTEPKNLFGIQVGIHATVVHLNNMDRDPEKLKHVARTMLDTLRDLITTEAKKNGKESEQKQPTKSAV